VVARVTAAAHGPSLRPRVSQGPLLSTAEHVQQPAVSERSAERRYKRTPLNLPTKPAGTARDATAAMVVSRSFAANEWRTRLTLVFADIVAALTAGAIALGAPSAGLADRLLSLGLAGVVVVASNAYGLYDRDALLIRKTTLDETPKLFHLATTYVLVVWLVEDALGGTAIAPTDGLLLLCVTLTLMLTFRSVSRAILRRATGPERCMFIGDRESARRLEEMLAEAGNAELVSRMSLRKACTAIDCDRGDAGALHDAAQRDGVQRIIIGQCRNDSQGFTHVLRAAKRLSPRVNVLADLPDVLVHPMVAEDLDGMMLLGLRRYGLSPTSAVLKRVLDVCGAGLLLVVCAPLVAALALFIKVDSAGPILFRQTRVGRDGKHFAIFKFRTMGVDAEARKGSLRGRNEAATGLFKIARDPRITRVGRMLRVTCLDEVPQLLNVVRGEMSLVGPRPLVCDEDEQIRGFDRHRLHVKPGMTGVWQIAGSSRISISEMAKMDYRYVAGWSVWSDIKIVLRTLSYVLARRGL
jgi:exopolysaccharide biosynthesis polyprenyl glycosylphosphotransferase